MLYEIVTDKELKCNTHGDLDKILLIDKHEECPYCVLEFLKDNKIKEV